MSDVTCDQCGQEWEASLELRFCGHCGASLESDGTSAPASPEQNAVEGELRYATVLFADIKGFTSFSEDRPPDLVAEVVGNLLEQLGDAIRQEGGSVDKYIGDAVMATFGLIEPNPHAARTAVKSGFRMQNSIDAFCEETGYDFSLRIGIHAGEMVRVSVDDSFTVMGDSVNTAARIEGEAEPGGVLISDPVKKSLRGWGSFRKEGEVSLKGKTGTTSLYVPLREEDRDVEQEGLLQRTRFVGRENELDAVRSVIDDARDREDLRLTFVRGETGVGKSRFAEEIQELAGKRDFAWSGVQYDQMYSGMLDGIGQIVTDFFDLQLPGDPSDVLDRIRRQLDSRFTWIPAERRDVVTEFFGFLLGLEQEDFDIFNLDAETKMEMAWVELKNWLQGFGRENPIIWCLEDVQNGDRNTARFLEWGLDVAWNGPVCVIGTVREEELQDGSEWQKLIDGVKSEEDEEPGRRRTITLDPLTPDHLSDALSTALPGRVNRGVTDRIAEYCEGNPLFGVETLRELKEDGQLQQEDDEPWDLITSWDDVELPETVREVMEARLQRLPREGIDLAKRGGVMGQRFFLDPLRTIYGDRTDHLTRGKDVLTARDLLFFEGSQFLKDREEGVFHNNRFRRAAAARATNRERRSWMGSIASWCEDTYEETDNPTVSGQVLLPLMGRALNESDHPGRARMVYEWAGWLLYDHNRFEKAITNFRKALFGLPDEEPDPAELEAFGDAMFPDPPSNGVLRSLVTVREAQIRNTIGETQGALGELEQSLDTLRPVSDLLSSVEDRFDPASTHPVLLDRDELHGLFEEPEHSWWTLTPEESRILNFIEMIDLEIKNGNMEAAESLVERTWNVFDDLRPSVPGERKHHLYANWLYKKIWMKGESMGRPDEALSELQPIYTSEDPVVGSIDELSPENRADLSHLRSTLLFFTGDLDEALSEEQSVLEYWRKQDRKDKEAPSLNLIGNISRGLGDFGQAEEHFSGARDIYQDQGRRLEEAKTLGNLGSVYINRGELKQAEDAFIQYRDISEEIGFRQGKATALGNLGLVYLDRGESEKAAEHFEQQIDISRRIQDRQGEALALGNLGFAYHDLGAIEQALECYREQLSISREIGYTYGEEVALGSLAELLRNRFSEAVDAAARPDDPVEAYRLTQSAIDLADSTGNKMTKIHMLLNRSILLRWAGAEMYPIERPRDEDVRSEGLERLRRELTDGHPMDATDAEERDRQIDDALDLCESTQVEPSLHAELLIEKARHERLKDDPSRVSDLLDRAGEQVERARQQGADVRTLETQLDELQ